MQFSASVMTAVWQAWTSASSAEAGLGTAVCRLAAGGVGSNGHSYSNQEMKEDSRPSYNQGARFMRGQGFEHMCYRLSTAKYFRSTRLRAGGAAHVLFFLQVHIQVQVDTVK